MVLLQFNIDNGWTDGTDSNRGRDKVMYVKNVYAYHRSHKDRSEQGFPWWQLGEFTSSAIDVANMDTLQQLCTRLFVLDKARQVETIFAQHTTCHDKPASQIILT